jgi:putative phosphoribosyl transferase
MALDLYEDRRDAGRRLAQLLTAHAGAPDTLVLGLPRGGVVVAHAVAKALGLPLDVLVVRKLGLPSQPEVAMGAIATGDVLVTNAAVLQDIPNARDIVQRVMEEELEELHRREKTYRGHRPIEDVARKTVLLIDDGMATGATMRAALLSLRQRQVRRCIVAVPVAAPQACMEIRKMADEVVCPLTPTDFRGVGQFYQDFEQTTDAEVLALLEDLSLKVPSRPGSDRTER